MPDDFVYDGLQYAVIGDPIAHSLSPQMHNAALRALNMNARYIAVHVLKEDLASFTENARKYLAGFNITVPHKNNIIPFLDHITENAALAESVNTVTVNPDGTLSGDSTDGYGFEMAVREGGGPALSGISICFIGCGGVVPALAFHAAFCGAKSIRIVNRTVEKAENLSARLAVRFPGLHCYAGTLQDGAAFAGADLTVQCTSLGLKETDPAPVDPHLLSPETFLFDTIYKETPLLQYARVNGIACSGGSAMLLHQGARSFTIWTGKEAPVEVMRTALAEARG